jgi:FixJ family two-component response regulator
MPEMSDALPTTKQAPVTEPGFHHDATVFIIDDDVSIRKALARVIRSAGYDSEYFPTAEDFLQREEYVGAGCIVVDLHLPGASGLDLQRDIEARECNLPMIFITGGGDATSSVLAMKRGAQDFLSKPVDEEQLLSAIATATEKSRVIWEQHEELTAAREKIAKLTPREIEIMKLIVKGSRNKQIAGMLGISEKTVKVHRGNVMKKFDARTVTDLVHVAETAAVNAETSA